jgi:RNA polymerase sigma factor (TIGR02999 family)
VTWEDRGSFFAHAGRAMRRVLVDYARRHRALRRGGGRALLSLEPTDATSTDARSPLRLAAAERAEELLALDEALERLDRLAPRLARVVEMRFFAGLSEAETAAALGVTARTVGRDWVKARAWLQRDLREAGDGR